MFEMFDLMSQHILFFASMVFILGLLVGSFLNVVIHRLPIIMERSWKQEFQSYFHPEQPVIDEEQSNESYNLIVPGSTCPKCGHKIKAWENIPVISWLVQRGKCTNCQTSISIRYPTVELITGLLSLVVALHFGYSMACLAALLLTWSLIALTFIDADTMLLPDQITLPLMWVGLLISTFSVFVAPETAIIGAIIGYLSLWSLYWGFKLLTGKEGMGYGDFKLLAALGAWVGWTQLPIVIILSSFVGAFVGIVIIGIKGRDKNIPIPFGPYLAVAGWLTFMYGDWISAQYWRYILG